MTAGYVAIDREIFDHPLFQGAGGDARLVAWERLLAKATFRPDGQPRRYRTIHLDRAQICATHRELVRLFGWKIGRVQRFLKMLLRHGMVALSKSGDSKNESEIESKRTYQQTVITICNYDKWQRALAGKWKQPSQTSSQTSSQTNQEALFDTEQFASQPLEPTYQEYKSLAREVDVDKLMPPDGKIDKVNRMIWAVYGGWHWRCYEPDFVKIRGVTPMPRAYLDGRGMWFMVNGEITRPKRARKRA